ncbi:MAG: RnfABCDGE type electron transport complex subunit D [Pseudohongiellaceae bacterium]
MSLIASGPPYQFAACSTNRIMLEVIFACIPGITITTWFFGWGTLINITLACVMALALEAGMLALRGRAPVQHLRDNSALVTAVLLGIALPSISAWWMIALATVFAIVIAKHLYGGLGQNVFNPAMCGYVFLLITFPLHMSGWHAPGGDEYNPLGLHSLYLSLQMTFPFLAGGAESYRELADGLAMATPLLDPGSAAGNAINRALEGNLNLFSPGAETGYEMISMGYLAGGLFLLFRNIISWHIPASILVTVAALAVVFYNPDDPGIYGTPWLHLFGTPTMLGAFFIATDPVSAATTPRGKLLYGVIIGCCIYSIRSWGAYPDSVAFAILFGNFCASFIERVTVPTVYGSRGRQIK